MSFNCWAQTLEKSLYKAHCTMYGGNIYSYGLSMQNKITRLTVYKMDKALKITDSAGFDLGKYNLSDYLQLSSDTLHDYLNIYLQRKEKKLVQVIRFNKYFKQMANIENVDIARLNSISAFESEIFYYRKDIYSVKVSSSDTAGRQFYLNKYTLKSDLKNFEYDFKWQFPFEKKNINSAHIILVNSRLVMLYVNVIEGPKSGQWLLKVNPLNGSLIHGTKIGIKGDADFYSFGAVYTDSVSGIIYILGQKFPATDFSQKDNKFSIGGKPFTTLYLAKRDSASEIISRDEFKIPVIEPKGNKIANAYILRPANFRKTENNFRFETDVYKGNSPGCYRYCNTISNTITSNEDKLSMDKSAVTSNTLIEKYYFNNDNADMNGKLCSDSLSEFEKIYYKFIPFKVKAGFKLDETGSPEWLLHKSASQKGIESYALLKQDKKVYQLQKPEEINKSENPYGLRLSDTRYILTRQIAEDKFQLKLFTW
ncbi:MAG: hypothetical protein ACXVNM_12740 [Bacteroidia bacterium]